ncbi:MAG: nitrous oxide reductase family maturation protein NosD, partial [Candidatus Hodarchaeota archaeon]
VILDNEITTPGEAIYLEDSGYNVIDNNTIIDGGDYGIDLYQSHYCTTSGNTISNCSNGINYGHSNHSLISDNIVSSNEYSGIYLSYCLENVTITGNTILNNIEDGINLDESSNVLVTMNSIYANDRYGIHVHGSSENNTIFLNYVANNDMSDAYSAPSGSETSDWDNGTHGNYWGDYETLFPLATNNSGIWNTPYPINNSNSVNDSYPLAIWPLPEGDGGDGNGGAVPSYLPAWIFMATIVGTVLIITRNKMKIKRK